MSDALRFARNIRSRASRIQNGALAATKMVAKTALRELVYGTPVDVGTARSNWRVSIGNPTRSVVPAYSPGKKLGIDETGNADAAIAAGYAVIDRLRNRSATGTVGAIDTAFQAGESLYITNSVPYLEKLRSGTHSKQQRRDWVEDAGRYAMSRLSVVRLLEFRRSTEDDGD